jgi:hypothetical protein
LHPTSPTRLGIIMRGTLYIRLRNGRVLVYELFGQTIAIGRGIDVDVLIPDPTVAPRHALLIFPGGELAVEDMGSTLGTLVGTVRLQPHELYYAPANPVLFLGDAEVHFVRPHQPPPAWIQTIALEPRTSSGGEQAKLRAEYLPTNLPPPVSDTQPSPVVRSADPVKLQLQDPWFGQNFVLRLQNRANSAATLELRAVDRHGALQYQFEHQSVALAAGESTNLNLLVQMQSNDTERKRRRYPFVVQVYQDDQLVTEANSRFEPGFVRENVLLGLLGSTACLFLSFFVAAVTAFCPTTLAGACLINIPSNPLSRLLGGTGLAEQPPPTPINSAESRPSPTFGLATASATARLTATRFVTFTALPPEAGTPTATATRLGVVQTDTARPNSPTPAFSATPTFSPTPSATPTPATQHLLLYTVSNGRRVTLFGLSNEPNADPKALLSDVQAVRVLDYNPILPGKLALWVQKAGVSSLWLLDGAGKVLAQELDAGWDELNSAEWDPTGTWLFVQASIQGKPTYLIYSADGDLIARPLLFARTATPQPSATNTR